MTQPSLFSSITSAVSDERFNPYLSSSNQSESVALGVYAWNIALCESLYPCLNNFEISLRNAIHGAATQKFDQPEWILNHLHRNESEPLHRRFNKLARERKVVNVGDLIANSTLGFWLSLFRSRYEQVLWPELLEPVFPNCPRSRRTRRNMYARLDMIHRFRNRVFHHEPVWHLQDLEEQHQRILETIGWISPAMLAATRMLDRFDSVYTRGAHSYANELESIAQNWGAQ